MSKNDITGDNITTKPATEEYRENYDKIFKKTQGCGCKERCIEYEAEYNEYLEHDLSESPNLNDSTD